MKTGLHLSSMKRSSFLDALLGKLKTFFLSTWHTPRRKKSWDIKICAKIPTSCFWKSIKN